MLEEYVSKWRSSYPGLPDLPSSKRWMANPPNTPEQLVMHKLMLGQQISIKEAGQLQQAIAFYEKLIRRLRSYNMTTLMEDVDAFRPYFFYCFNNFPQTQVGLHANHVVRVVKNESILRRKDRIFHLRDLSFPSKEIVKRNNKYNRANTPDFNVFYGSTCLDSVINELKPGIGDLVTAGIWKKLDECKPLLVYPMTHSKSAIEVNVDAKTGYTKFLNEFERHHPLSKKFMEMLFGFISEEFAKSITFHAEYLFSALLSEWVLHHNDNPIFQHHAIAYPSVENKFSVPNLAIKPDVITNQYVLSKVMEFEITDTHYDQNLVFDDIEKISIVGYKNFSLAKEVKTDGSIEW
jgi:hypothetical protein